MAAHSRPEQLHFQTQGFLPGFDRRISAVTIICWAQLLMVVANLVRIPLVSAGDRDIPITINELCVATIVASAALVMLNARSARLDRVAMIALVFVAIGGTSAVWSVNRFDLTLFQVFVSLAFLARWVMYFGVYVAVINVVQERGVETIWGALELMLMIIAVFGIFQAAFLPGFAQMVYPDSRAYIDWDPQGHRLVSTILDPNLVAAMLMIGLLVQLARVSVGASQPPWRVLIIFVAFTLTLSRGAAMGFVVGSLVLLAARGLSRRLLRAALVAGILMAAASPLLVRYALTYGKFSIGLGSSAALRVESWLEMIGIISAYPIFGVGFNSYKYALIHFGLDRAGLSSYGGDGGLLFIMAMTGIVGLVVYCLMLRQILARCRSIWRDRTVTPEHRGIAIGTAASIVAIVVSSASANAILTTFIMEMFWVLSGLTFVIARARDQRAVGDTDPGRSRAVAMAA
jgi:hypothetical protein